MRESKYGKCARCQEEIITWGGTYRQKNVCAGCGELYAKEHEAFMARQHAEDERHWREMGGRGSLYDDDPPAIDQAWHRIMYVASFLAGAVAMLAAVRMGVM